MDHKRSNAYKSLHMECLEDRRCLAASLGWDGPGQGSASLTYYIDTAPASVSQQEFESAIKTALKVWSDVVDVTFTQTNQAGLARSLDFTSSRIDGAGGTLAQAYFPVSGRGSSLAGDVTFDSSEKWEVGNAQGNSAYDLVYVAVHEIGHALGLDHSQVAGSVLAATASASQVFTGLSAADVDAALALYAPAKNTTGTTTTGATNGSTTGTSGIPSEGTGSNTPTSGTSPSEPSGSSTSPSNGAAFRYSFWSRTERWGGFERRFSWNGGETSDGTDAEEDTSSSFGQRFQQSLPTLFGSSSFQRWGISLYRLMR